MEYIEKVIEMGPTSIFMAIILLAVCAKFLFEIIDYFLQRFGIETKNSLKKKAMEKEIESLKAEMQTYKENRIHDREQSFEIQKQLTERQEIINGSLVDIKDIVNNLAITIQDMQEKSDSQERAKLKDRISQSYRYYHKEQKWTSMDKESFNDLIRSYESAGGKNSFVHSTCEPESETWEIIDE